MTREEHVAALRRQRAERPDASSAMLHLDYLLDVLAVGSALDLGAGAASFVGWLAGWDEDAVAGAAALIDYAREHPASDRKVGL